MNVASGLRAGQPLIGLPRICLRQISHSGKRKEPSVGFQGPEGHGEKIWIWSHRRTDQTVYTLRDRLNDHHDLKQIPFNGKKLKPATLRKDYWSPMAIIEFPQGHGSVGRSVFQKLRELKHLHEVSWPEDMRLKTEDEYTEQDIKRIKNAKEEGRTYVPVRTKRQRGAALCAQKKNSIADMAAVLAGQGRGNKIVAGEGEGELVPVTVNWANDQDKRYAESWSDNVTHGLVEKPAYVLGDDVPEPTKTNPVLRAT
ncbi:hypothetical protein ACRE_074750 [Hapsidospora chrysogenum ATCC 11550]|uniref:Large ribosomal subunit protein mL67 n=1 Tax=Hapsidospora chrysogenum (strain ATCC 11550 / CBS 779.69 / DSM 880 / IAM 14645 / JCM 23072 / IMI 49137) TaxID=857340 RepID=A0A086SXH3_HAPC1|nr:hypothetical protein ACRE_074750 [Hapsidospora chrysogenum ATCC 11550]